ncbi:unnamed protein product, partial [Arabidopsis halleri]
KKKNQTFFFFLIQLFFLSQKTHQRSFLFVPILVIIMNSMFSAFDAMCAEIMGKKVTAASYVYRSERNSASSDGGQNASLSLKKVEKASKNMDLPTKTPRFADSATAPIER